MKNFSEFIGALFQTYPARKQKFTNFIIPKTIIPSNSLEDLFRISRVTKDSLFDNYELEYQQIDISTSDDARHGYLNVTLTVSIQKVLPGWQIILDKWERI